MDNSYDYCIYLHQSYQYYLSYQRQPLFLIKFKIFRNVNIFLRVFDYLDNI